MDQQILSNQPNKQSSGVNVQTPSAKDKLIGSNQQEQPTSQPSAENDQVAVQASSDQQTAQKSDQGLQQRDEKSVETVKKRITMSVELATFFTITVVAINGLLIYLTNNQVKQYRFNRQQIAAALYNSSDIQNTVDFLETQKQQTELINQALPNEQEFIQFVQTLELIAGEAATNSQFEFESLKRISDKNLIPVRITMTTTSSGFSEFLSKAEKLPYLFQVNEIEASSLGEEDIWQYRLNGIIYVSNKFR
jgi:hypothetical protein